MNCEKEQIKKESKEYWTNRAKTYSELNQSELSDAHHKMWKQMIQKQISDHFPTISPEKLRILEIGTGPGFLSILLAEEGYQVTAIDLTPSMLEEAKQNAGDLSARISFQEMDAEQLTFSSESFDVVISRNVTWNLPHPKQAYAQWCRVLKQNGLLLNFDANWYHYLFYDNAKTAYKKDRQNVAKLGIADQNIGKNFDVMEKIAQKVPLSRMIRPKWDVAVLQELGMNVQINDHIWEEVWLEEEKTNFSSTPLFLIRAVREETSFS